MANTSSYYYGYYPDDYGYYWWGAPYGVSDYDLCDYNNNWVLDDNEIADEVRDSIYADQGITASDTNSIKVAVKDSVVTLSGQVRNPRSKTFAYIDAFWSSGVTDVTNNIQVKQRTRKQSQQSGSKR